MTETDGSQPQAVYLRHEDATKQAWLWGIFGTVPITIVILSFALGDEQKWYRLFLVPLGLLGLYSSARLATLKVRLDAEGLWEPSPFKLSYVTPWSQITKVSLAKTEGRVTFYSPRIVEKDGHSHEVLALKMQTKFPDAEQTVRDWIKQIETARKTFK